VAECTAEQPGDLYLGDAELLAEARQRAGNAQQLRIIKVGKLLACLACRSRRRRYRLAARTYHGA
jgi:hypothetical protein